jgi:hypothetical protein
MAHEKVTDEAGSRHLDSRLVESYSESVGDLRNRLMLLACLPRMDRMKD